MGTLKTTLKVESTDLFPTPVNFTTVNNNSITIGSSNFVSVAVANGTPVTVADLSTYTSGGYLYVQSPSTNTDNILIQENGGPTVYVELIPGDVGLIPLGDNGAGLVIEADTVSGTQTLNFYFGSR
jgi:hypothetical protein